jgi:ribosomal-protein-alanine N-acetyltransferase
MMTWLSELWGGDRAVVEPASQRDVAAFARIHHASFHRGWGEDEFERMLHERNTLVHRLRMGRKTVGSFALLYDRSTHRLPSIGVPQPHRGRGLSNSLLLTHLGHLAGRGIRTVFLEVEENNQPARRLYQRAGFSVVGRRERYYRQSGSEALDALLMRRDLS